MKISEILYKMSEILSYEEFGSPALWLGMMSLGFPQLSHVTHE